MRAPLRVRKPWSREQLGRLREIERNLHVRAFGEEMARVNLDLNKRERLQYLADMRAHARSHGVRIDRPPPFHFES